MQWQKTLYKKIGSKKEGIVASMERSIERVLAMAKVLQGLHWVGVYLFRKALFLVSDPTISKIRIWKKKKKKMKMKLEWQPK